MYLTWGPVPRLTLGHDDPLCSLVLRYVLQHRWLNAIGQKKAPLLFVSHASLEHIKEAERRARRSGQNVWYLTIWALDRTSAQPQVNLRNSLKFQPQESENQEKPLTVIHFIFCIFTLGCTNAAHNYRNISLKEPLGNTPLRWMYIVYNNTVRGLQHHYLCLEETGLDPPPLRNRDWREKQKNLLCGHVKKGTGRMGNYRWDALGISSEYARDIHHGH